MNPAKTNYEIETCISNIEEWIDEAERKLGEQRVLLVQIKSAMITLKQYVKDIEHTEC